MTLYRTHRPQRFSELLGQDTASRVLQQALLRDRIAHAYLFTGPRGTGKTSTARIFTRALVCSQPVKKPAGSYEPCNTCEYCTLLIKGQNSDVIEIDAASNRGIEDIRELREQVSYPPSLLPRKIYIIDEVHMLTTEAFNALLKTLEEPPEYCLFILATTELHKVPLTIRSRCQVVRFNRGSRHTISQKLQVIVTQEGLSVEPAALDIIAEHAEGGYRDAETLLESLTTQHTPLSADQVRKSLGSISEELAKKLLHESFTGDDTSLRETLRTLSQEVHGSVELSITQLIELARRGLYDQSVFSSPPPSLDHIRFALQQLLEAYIFSRYSPSPFLPLELACFAIAGYKQPSRPVHTRPTPVETEVPKTPAVAHSVPVTVLPPTTAPQEATVPVIELQQEHIRDLRKAWKQMTEQVCLENLPLGQALKETIFHTADNQGITIHVRFKFHADKMKEKKNRDRIKTILKDLTGQELEVMYQVSDNVPKQRMSKEISSGVAEAATSVFGK